MEPDYSNYSRKELLEAYESVDRSVYPCRFEKIESELKKYKAMEPTGTIVGQFQNYVFTGVSLLTLVFIVGIWGSIRLWELGLQEFEQLAFPFVVVLSPIGMWQAHNRWKKHRNDYIQFDDIGVTHQEVEEKKFFAWSEIESVWFARIRYQTQVCVSIGSGDCICVYLVHSGIDTSELKAFLIDKSSIHNFTIKKYFFGLIPLNIRRQ